MKFNLRNRFLFDLGRLPSTASLLVSFIGMPASLSAATRYYDAATSTVWDTNTTQNWGTVSGGPYAAAKWAAYDEAVFQGTGASVTATGTVNANRLTFSTNGYTLTGGTIAFGNPGGFNVTVASGVTATVATNMSQTLSSGIRMNGGGTLNLTGTNTISNNWVSDVGTTAITGGTTTAASLWTGDQSASSNGTMRVSAGTLNVTSTATVGTRGLGFLTIDGSGQMSAASVVFGHASTSGGTGTVNLDGGSLTTGSVKEAGTNTSTFNFNGGTLKASASTAAFLQGLNGANVRNGGAIVDSDDKEITIAQPLLHSGISGDNAIDGGLTKNGTGTLTLTTPSTYTGATLISAGSLILTGGSIANSAEVTVASGATLDGGSYGSGQTVQGTGTLAGAVAINAGATLSPAGSATVGSMTVSGSLTLAGTLVMNIHKTGATLSSDQLTGGGSVALGGGLSVIATGDTLALGDTFTLFANLGGRTGVFSSAGYTLPVLPAGLYWDKSKLATDGTISVVNVQLPDIADTPLISPPSGAYAGLQVASVTLSSNPGSTIYYTVDGSNPTSSSPSAASPVTISSVPADATNYTIKAFARKAGLTDSTIASSTYNTVPTPTWNVDADGLWSDSGLWLKGVVPDGIGVPADFGTFPQSAPSTVTLDSNRTVGAMKFTMTDLNFWTLTAEGSSALTLATTSGSPVIEVVSSNTIISAPLAGSQGLTKTGAGTLELTGNNSYSGTTTISEGSLVSTNANRLGSGPVVIATGGTYQFTTSGSSQPTLSNVFSGAGTAVINASSGNQPFYSGDWSGFTGTLGVNRAYQASGNNHGSASMKMLVKNSGSYLGLFETATTANTYQVGELSGDASTKINTGTATGGVVTLAVGALGTDSTYAGTIVNSYNGGTNSVIALSKLGAGTFTLSGANTYLGGTNVEAGTLALIEGGSLAFRPGANGVSNRITGTGSVTLDGTFNLNLSTANLTAGNSWNLVDVAALNESYGEHFAVAGFTGANGVWTLQSGANRWTFTQATGNLTLEIVAGYSGWATANAGGQGPELDFDNDGVKNGIEYFMGQTGSGFTALPGPMSSGGVTTVTWTRDPAATVSSFAVQSSSTLNGDWAPVPAGDVNLSDPTKVIYTFAAPLSGKRFVRLSVVP